MVLGCVMPVLWDNEEPDGPWKKPRGRSDQRRGMPPPWDDRKANGPERKRVQGRPNLDAERGGAAERTHGIDAGNGDHAFEAQEANNTHTPPAEAERQLVGAQSLRRTKALRARYEARPVQERQGPK